MDLYVFIKDLYLYLRAISIEILLKSRARDKKFL